MRKINIAAQPQHKGKVPYVFLLTATHVYIVYNVCFLLSYLYFFSIICMFILYLCVLLRLSDVLQRGSFKESPIFTFKATILYFYHFN